MTEDITREDLIHVLFVNHLEHERLQQEYERLLYENDKLEYAYKFVMSVVEPDESKQAAND